jgi:hypothetical protein
LLVVGAKKKKPGFLLAEQFALKRPVALPVI